MPRPGGARVLRGYGGMPRSTREMTVITVTFPSFGAPSSHANRDFFHEVLNPIPSERVHSPAKRRCRPSYCLHAQRLDDGLDERLSHCALIDSARGLSPLWSTVTAVTTVTTVTLQNDDVSLRG